MITDEQGSLRYGRESLEFARVVNLGDAVFAIAMTLLVLTLEGPGPAADLGRALADLVPRLGVVVLAFLLVASIWWQHHRLFATLGEVEPGLVAIDLALLGAVALVPFPTSLLGQATLARAAVLPFIGVFWLLSVLFLLMLLRARATGAWRRPLPDGLFPWLLAGWAWSIGLMSLAGLAAIWSPLVGLALLAVSGVPEIVVRRRAPAAYRQWA